MKGGSVEKGVSHHQSAQGGTRTHTLSDPILSRTRLPIPPQGHMVRVVGLEPTRHR